MGVNSTPSGMFPLFQDLYTKSPEGLRAFQNDVDARLSGAAPIGTGTNFNEPAQYNLGAQAAVFRGADGTSTASVVPTKPGVVFQFFRKDASSIGVQLGFYQTAVLDQDTDFYGLYQYSKFGANLAGASSRLFNAHGIRSYLALDPTNVGTNGLHGYAGWIQVNKGISGIRAVGLQLEASNSSGVDDLFRITDGLHSSAALAISSSGNAHASTGIFFEGPQNAVAYYTGMHAAANAVCRHFIDTRDLNFRLQGTITATNGSPTITGVGTKFLTEMMAGDHVVIDGVFYMVLSTPVSNTSATLSANFTGTTGAYTSVIKTVVFARLSAVSYITATDAITGATDYRLLGLNASNRVHIDADAKGTLFSGNVELDGTGTNRIYLSNSSGVAHSMTSQHPANVFGGLILENATVGGLSLRGLTDADGQTALSIDAMMGTTTPTVTAMRFRAFKYDGGTNITSLAATEIAFQFRNNATNLITVLGGGTVGINATVPGAKLEVNGNVLFQDLTRIQGAVNIPTGATGVGLEFFAQSGNGVVQSFNRTTSALSPLVFNVSESTFNSSGLFQSLLRVQGSVVVPTGATGAGAEIFASGGAAWLQSFNRTTFVLSNLIISASRTQSAAYVSQTTGWAITDSGDADFRYIYSDQLHAKSFIADLEQALAGGQIISKSVAELASAFTLPAAGGAGTLVVKDLPSAAGMAVFQSGDIVRLRQFSRAAGDLTVADGWGVVTGFVNNGNGTQNWTWTRSTGGNAGTATGTIQRNTLALDYGTTGNGFHEVNAIDGTYGVNSPYSQIVTWATHPQNGQTVRTRLGNLKGITSATEFGLYAGDGGIAATNKFVRISDVNFEIHNIGLQLYDSSTLAMSLQPSGPYFALGNPMPTSFLQASSEGIWMGKDGGGDYSMMVGQVDSGGNLIKGWRWTGGLNALTVIGTIYVEAGSIGGWSITTAAIENAAGTIKMRGAGNLAFGATPPTSASVGTGLFLDSAGMVGLLSNVVQAKFDAATGAITAGAGAVTLNSTGISIASGTGYAAASSYKHVVGANTIADFYAFKLESPLFTIDTVIRTGAIAGYDTGVNLEARAATGQISAVRLNTQVNSVVQSYVNLENASIQFGFTAGEAARITSANNLKIAGTATRGTTEGTNHIDIFNGTAPVGTLTNGVSLYSVAGKLWAMDAAGNATKLTP